MAVGETRITGLLEGQDVLDTAKAMRAFGADGDAARRGRLDGATAWASAGFAEPADVIDCGNSGTGVRLIMGTHGDDADHGDLHRRRVACASARWGG